MDKLAKLVTDIGKLWEIIPPLILPVYRIPSFWL